jgi:hypothetical protein
LKIFEAFIGEWSVSVSQPPNLEHCSTPGIVTASTGLLNFMLAYFDL